MSGSSDSGSKSIRVAQFGILGRVVIGHVTVLRWGYRATASIAGASASRVVVGVGEPSWAARSGSSRSASRVTSRSASRSAWRSAAGRRSIVKSVMFGSGGDALGDELLVGSLFAVDVARVLAGVTLCDDVVALDVPVRGHLGGLPELDQVVVGRVELAEGSVLLGLVVVDADAGVEACLPGFEKVRRGSAEMKPLIACDVLIAMRAEVLPDNNELSGAPAVEWEAPDRCAGQTPDDGQNRLQDVCRSASISFRSVFNCTWRPCGQARRAGP